MKKQNGFISSSSSVSICYTNRTTVQGYSNYTSVTSNWSVTSYGAPYTVYSNLHETQTSNSSYSWKTYASTSYMRIEYFLEAVEKLGSEYSKDTFIKMPLTNYSRNVASDNLYNGFVDIVITFQTNTRLCGIELLNPWVNKLSYDEDASNWMYLPTKFNIYKVDNSKINDALNEITYENDVACITDYAEHKTIRPMRYDTFENDKNLIFLGNYNVNWKNKASYKCFFKFNEKDAESINLKNNDNSVGTATWECKQLVLRIFESSFNSSLKNIKVPGKNYTYIEENIRKYILNKEIEYGTKYAGENPTIDNIGELLGKSKISKSKSASSLGLNDNWKFGSSIVRSYTDADIVYFTAGIKYKLGGIQILLSPDIFSISEMKMYNYSGKSNNKVYIGEWNKDAKRVEYYGAKTIKTSPYIDIDPDSTTIRWRHNFNLPPKYLDAQLFLRFKMSYDTFNVGDVITNIVNVNNNPLSMKLTGSTIEVNISNGIGFTNPETGEFLTFMKGLGVQMDKPGSYDALKAAEKVGANILDAGSYVSSKMEGDCPFQIYFVIKRLF